MLMEMDDSSDNVDFHVEDDGYDRISTMVLMLIISKVVDEEDDLKNLNVDIVIIILVIVDIKGGGCRR